MHRNHLILALTGVSIVAALAWRSRAAGADEAPAPAAAAELPVVAPTGVPTSTEAALVEAPPPAIEQSAPRMVELGSDRCAGCRAMIPVLAELRAEHAGELEVDFIDVWEFPEQAEPFHVRVIPTQVFLAPDGTELARHEGFYAADAIRARWASLGFELQGRDEAP